MDYNKISAIVDHFLIKKGQTEHYFNWVLAMVLWYLRELRLDSAQDIKTELLPVTDRKTVILPLNCVDVILTAVKVGQYAVTLGVNDKLTLLDRQPNSADFVHGLLSQNLPNGLNFNAYSGFNMFNYNGGSISSYGGGFAAKGTFRIHDNGTCKEILLDYDYPYTEVYVEYITDGFDPCGETVVNPYLADYCLKAAELAWEEEKNPNSTENSIFRKGQDLHYAEKKVRARKNDLDPQTLLNISRQQTRFTPKI
jgi:hypothetical protein